MSAGAKALVLAKLQQVFGKYVDGITPENLKVQVLAGTITQHNLCLREEALSELNLPITVRAGRLGKFVVRVPWRHLASQPVVVEIDTVELLALTNQGLQDRPEPELVERIRSAIQHKLTRIENAEITRQGRAEMSSEKYLDRLGRRILENLRVRLTGVHLRFEDPYSSPCVAVGLTMQELSVISTDASWSADGTWVEREADREERRKLLRMSELEVYWQNPPDDQQLLPQLERQVDVETAFRLLSKAREMQIAQGGKALQQEGVALPKDSVLCAKQERRARRAAKLEARGGISTQLEREIAELDEEISLLFTAAYEKLYWSRQCLVSRTSFEVKVTLGDPPASKLYQVEGVMRGLSVRLTHAQHLELAAFAKRFGQLKERSQLQRMYPRMLDAHPCFGGIPKSRWRQAVALVRDRRCYVDAYRQKLEHASGNTLPMDLQLDLLQVMEWRLPVPVVMAFRSIADAEVAAQQAKSEAVATAGAVKPPKSKKLFKRLKPKSDQGGSAVREADTDGPALTEAERHSLFHSMDSPVDSDHTSLQAGFCSAAVRLVLETSCVTIATEDLDIIQVEWDGVYTMRKIASGDGGQHATEVDLSVDTLRVHDCTGAAERWSNLVGDLPLPGSGLPRTASTSVDPLDVPRVVITESDGSTPRSGGAEAGACISFRQVAMKLKNGELAADQLVYVPPAAADDKHRVEDLVDIEEVLDMDDDDIEELALQLKAQLRRFGHNDNQAIIINATLTPEDVPNSISVRVPRALQVVYNPAIMRDLVELFRNGDLEGVSINTRRKVDVSKTKSKLKNAAQADWHVHADIMTPVFLFPGDCHVADGPCAVLDLGRLEVDVHHGGQYPPPDVTDIGNLSQRSDGSIQLPSADTVFSSAIKVKMSGMQLLASASSVDWARELALRTSDSGLVSKCTVNVDISAAQWGWCARANTGSVCFEATPSQWDVLQDVRNRIQAARRMAGMSPVRRTRSQRISSLARKATPRATRTVASTLIVVCPRSRCVILEEDRTRMLSASMDELVIAANIGSLQHVFCAIRRFSITHKPEQPTEREIVRCIVDLDNATEDLVVVQYERSTHDGRTADHVVNFQVAEIIAEWHFDIMMQLKHVLHRQADHFTRFQSELGPEPKPEPEPEMHVESQSRLPENVLSGTGWKGTYRLMHDAVVRQGVELESPRQKQMKRGTVVEVLETATTRGHMQRVRCDEGWLSVRALDGTLLLSPTSTHAISAKRSSNVAVSLDSEQSVEESGVREAEEMQDDTLLVHMSGIFRGFTARMFKDDQQQYSFQLQEGSLEHQFQQHGVYRTVFTLTRCSIDDVGHSETLYPTILGPPDDIDATLIIVTLEAGDDWSRGRSSGSQPQTSRNREVREHEQQQRKATIKLSPMKVVFIKEVVDDIREYVRSALAVMMKLSDNVSKIELQIHDPLIYCPLSYTSRSYGLLSAEFVDIVRIGNYLQLQTEGGHSTNFHARYISDFGGCVHTVIDCQVTPLFLNSQVFPAPRHGVKSEMKAQMNVRAQHWDFVEGQWRTFADLAGEVPSIDVTVEKGCDGASRIDFDQYQNCIPVLSITDSLLTCLTESWNARKCNSTSVLENLCGISLIVRLPGGVPVVVPAAETIGLRTPEIRNASRGYVAPSIAVALENYEPHCDVPIFRSTEFSFVAQGLIDGRRKEVTVVFIVHVEAARIKIQCVSTLVVSNETALELEVMAVEQQVAWSGGVVPSKCTSFDVPVAIASASEIRFRPAALCDMPTFDGAPLLATPKLTADQPSSFELPGGERYFFRATVSPSKLRRFVTVQPAFTVRNHLPEPVRVGLRSSGSRGGFERCEIEGGLTGAFFSDSFGGNRSLDVDLHVATGRWQRITTTLAADGSDGDKAIDLRVPHQDGALVLTVRATFISPFELELSSRTWLCNKSGLQLRLECPGRWDSWPPAENTGVGDLGGVVSLDVGKSEEIGVAAGMSTFMPVKIDKLGQRRFVLPSRRERVAYNLHYIVDSGPTAFPMTTMITIRPTFGVVNEFKESIFIRCGDGHTYGAPKEVVPGLVIPLHFQSDGRGEPSKSSSIINCQFGFPSAGDKTSIVWSEDLLVDQDEQQKLSTSVEQHELSVEMMISRPEVAKLIVVAPVDHVRVYASPGDIEKQNVGPGVASRTSAHAAHSTLFVTGMFSKIEIQLAQMVLFRQRHETGPMRQKRLLSGDVFTCSMDNCRIEGRVTRPAALLKCVRVRVAHIRILDPKHRSGARIGKTVLEISHPSSHALDVKLQKEQGPAVPQIELVAAVGNLKVDIDDVFVTRCLLLQRNFLEHVSGRSEPATARSIIGGMKCELHQRILPPDITLFLKYLYVYGISSTGDSKHRRPIQVTASFRRLQTWLPNLFPVPQGAYIENQELRIPSTVLQSVLGDSGSVKNRVKASVLPQLKRQWSTESTARKLGIYASNFETLLDEATGGTGVSNVLAQKKAELGFRPVEFAENSAIIKSHFKQLRISRSQIDFDVHLWHMLYDWDFNHTGLDPMRRRIVVVALLNRSSRPVEVRDIRLAHGDKAYRSSAKLMPLDAGQAWMPSHMSVVVATGNSPFGARLGLGSGEVSVHIETDALQIAATHSGIHIKPLSRLLTHNIVSMDVHQWWSRWVLVISDKTVTLADRLITVSFQDPGPLGLQTDDRDSGVTVTGIQPNSQAAKHPVLRDGMRVVGVAGNDCSTMGYASIISLIREHPHRPLAITFLPADDHVATAANAEPQQELELERESAEPEPESAEAELRPGPLQADRLQRIKLSELKVLARSLGVVEDQLDLADDASDVKGAVIGLILSSAAPRDTD